MEPFLGGSAAADDGYPQLVHELCQFVQTQEQASQMSQPYAYKAQIEVSPEAEALLRESLAQLVDARPPADFVVYAGRAEEDSWDATVLGAAHHQPTEPPIFDGAVANATPPPLDGGPAGGAGTLLHLCAALDQPLALAMLLACGGDTRACHTAFRRLLIHEAACNGSLQSLTLLLELGREFQHTLEDPHSHNNNNGSGNGMMPPRLPRTAIANLPFLPRRLDRAQALAPLPFLAHHLSSMPSAKPAAPVLPLLHLFRSLVGQVREGRLTELDAARECLKHATIRPACQRSLARACHFQNSATTPAWRHPQSGGSLDGHGNTPLHWAGFKNEMPCVSLLLQFGADPNARAHPSGWTPLHDAAYSNSVESIDLLLRAGAHVDARANSGATPLCFAAQEDASQAVATLLKQGADLTIRCAGAEGQAAGAHSRFSGYTPLHYCAHYNAHEAARVLLGHPTARRALEISDLQDRLPIHVAVARGSADVLRELLRAGARVETRLVDMPAAPPTRRAPPSPEQPSTPRRRSDSNASGSLTPVSSPVLRSMIPSQPVTSTKPWNCLTQRSIDECRDLISQAESCWSKERHPLFTPADRQAVRTVLLLGQRLEQTAGLFPEVWHEVLPFCGRGWFDPEDTTTTETMVCEAEEEETGYHPHHPQHHHHDHLSLPTF
jgi:hypothetical protein